MDFSISAQYILSGITYGSIYAAVAIGFNIIYNSTGIINFAQGEFVMLGGMIACSLSNHMPLFPAVALAVLITTLIGSCLEIIFFRRLKNPSVLKMIIITIGLSILIREAALHIWDEKVRALKFFSGTEISSINVLGAHISPQVLWVLGFTAFIVIGLYIFFNFTLYGRAMRACSSNPVSASLCGINVRNMINLSFMLSAGIGGLAGCVLSPLTQTQYDMGPELAVKGFTVAILGGLGNTMTATAAGILLGIIEAFSIRFLPGSYKDVITIIILIVILTVRPSGLFGSREKASLKEF